MRYLCVHCDHRFDHEGDAKPRCPKCMRHTGIETIADPKKKGASAEAGPKKWIVPGAIAGAVALVAGGYAWWSSQAADTVSGDVPLRPLESSELRGHVRRLSAEPGDLVGFFEPNEAIEELGEKATGGSNEAKARAVVDALRARASKQAFVRWSLHQPRDTPIRTAARALEAMREDGARARLYPLEVAAIAVAALRTADVDAMIAEAYAFPGDRSPPDPSGHFGYYVVAVWNGEVGQGKPKLLDPWGGHGTAPGDDDYRVLNDVEALGAAVNHRALYELVHENAAPRAFELAQSALSLDRRSPSIRSARGVILLASGGTEEGVEEMRAAAQIRADAPRHNNLAAIHLAQQDVEGAQREIARALERHADFAGAHATMAALHLARGESELAQTELETAERLDGELPTLPMLWANFFLTTRDMERAVQKAAEAIERRPRDWQTRLQAAQVFRAGSRYDEMRREARTVLELVPAERREAMRALIGQILGPTALEEPEEDLLAGGGDDTSGDFELPSADLQLGGGSRLLGDEQGVGGSLLGGQGGDPLLLQGDPSTLRLREPGEGLSLDLGEE